MGYLSRAWPFGLNGKRWWLAAASALLVLLAALLVDRAVSVWAGGWPQPVLSFLRWLTRFGESDWILVPSGVLFLILWGGTFLVRRRLVRLALIEPALVAAFIFSAVGLTGILAQVIKRTFGRARPMQFDTSGLFGFSPGTWDWSYHSFPSGHATTAFALATALAFLDRRLLIPGLIFAVAICVSRVALGVHYGSDVFAGALLGILGTYWVRILFAQRGWLFRRTADGFATRKFSALPRYAALRRRRSVPAPPPGRP